MKLLNKIIAFSLVLLMIPSLALALNTYSVDLEASSSQYLSITDAAQTGLDLTGDFTIELNIKPESSLSSGGEMVLIDKDDTIIGNRGYYLTLYNDSGTIKLIIIFFGTGGDTNYDYLYWEFTPTVDTWQHIAVSIDISEPASTEAIFYLNGSSQGYGAVANNGNVTAIRTNDTPFRIGGVSRSAFFDGKIDDVRVWNDVRTPTEISDNYNKELTGTETNLVAYWKLNNSLLDETSNNNDLTNNNSATFSTDVPFTGATPAIVPEDYSQVIFHY